MHDPTECCENSGVKPPENLGSFVAEHQLTTMDAATPDLEKPEEEQKEDDIMVWLCKYKIFGGTHIIPSH